MIPIMGASVRVAEKEAKQRVRAGAIPGPAIYHAQMIETGRMNRLRVLKRVEFGLYLDGGAAGELLLPARYVPAGAAVGDELDVFYISRFGGSPDRNDRKAPCDGW